MSFINGPRSHDPTHLQAIIDAAPCGLLSFDANLAVLTASQGAGSLLGIEAGTLRDSRCLAVAVAASPLFDEAAGRQVHAACLAAAAGRTVQDVVISSRCGQRAFQLQISPLSAGQWLAVLEETTAHRAAEARAIEEAMRDPLTGLCNRALFQRHVGTAFGVAQDTAGLMMMLIDLDRFKAVNDTLGHAVGDKLLQLVAKRLISLVRKVDLMARLGGDEFALLIGGAMGAEDAASLAKRIVDVLSRPYLADGHLVTIGASIGIAASPGDGGDYDALSRSADLALYAAKNAGRNTHAFFDPSMDARATARRSLEIDLRRALAMCEFELHYQPQIDLEGDAVVGFEALLRWRHPERGLVPPAEFIGLAEEIGLIAGIGEWVLREACVEAAGWDDAISVAVNVSPYQFEDPGRVVEIVRKALARSGLPGHRLEIEITESVLLRNEGAVLAALHGLRAMGVRVAMDDFGTGYSSLSQLNSFPFDKIKIDRSFVKDNGDQSSQNAIIRAITALGVSLGMTTIAEGVETRDQLARIRAGGCTSVQGYLFSKPVPVDQVADLIATFSGRRKAAALSLAS